MKLIDADALRVASTGISKRKKIVWADITDAPTVDAIPVDWLKEQAELLETSNGSEISNSSSQMMALMIDAVIRLWHKNNDLGR